MVTKTRYLRLEQITQSCLCPPTKKIKRLKKYTNLIKEAKPVRPEQYFVSEITYVKRRESTH